MKQWQPGDRVTRQTVFDSGKWTNRGDSCIDSSSLRHGVVISRSTERDDEVLVRFDDGEEKRYLDHGLDKEKIEIVIGQMYQDKNGKQVVIGGHCTSHSEWFWSICGRWYDEEGQHLTFQSYSRNKYTTRQDSGHNLIRSCVAT